MDDYGPASDRITTIPLRPGIFVRILDLPADLTVAEARKIGNVIEALRPCLNGAAPLPDPPTHG